MEKYDFLREFGIITQNSKKFKNQIYKINTNYSIINCKGTFKIK